jgi:hypothetical protein
MSTATVYGQNDLVEYCINRQAAWQQRGVANQLERPWSRSYNNTLRDYDATFPYIHEARAEVFAAPAGVLPLSNIF